MFVISAGMPKSGSAYFYNVINGLLAASSHGKDARVIKQNRDLDDLMQWHNNNIGALTLPKLMRLWVISLQDGTFAVKTHWAPTPPASLLSKLGMVRIVYCYRDPRDVLLSAVDHGKEILNSGQNHTFATMVDFDEALNNVKSWLQTWRAYKDVTGLLLVKYEEMMQDPFAVAERIERFLNISVDPEIKQAVLWRFSKDNPNGDRAGMHFNKAMTYRYKDELTEAQMAKCINAFGDDLVTMGYDAE